MAWMFNARNRSTPRIFISFIECRINGTWDNSQDWVDSDTRIPVYRALNEENCIIDIVAPDGLRRSWRFKNGAHVTMTQNMLEFLSESVAEELSVDDDIKTRKKEKPRSTLE
jgi:hypothetical protein